MNLKNKIKVAFISASYRGFDGYRKEFGGKHPTNGIRILAGELLEHKLAKSIKIFDGAFYSSLEKLISDIKNFAPDVIGIPGYTDTVPDAIEILKIFKDIRIKISGGPYSTARPEELLNYVDVVFLGESEISIKEFFKFLNDNGLDLSKINLESIKGIAFKKNNELIINESAPLIHNLDTISFQGWKLVTDYIDKYKIAHYRHIDDSFISLMSSRGCDKNCIYCVSKLMHGVGIRFRSVENIKEEIELVDKLRKKNGIPKLKSIKFDDDDIFARDINELEKLFTMLSRKKLTFTGFGSFAAASKEKIKIAAELGMKSIFFGIETDEARRQIIGKGIITDEEIIETLQYCRKNRIRTSCGYIIGFPTETINDIQKTVKTMIELPVDYPSMNILTIHPGIPLWFWQQKNINQYPGLIKHPFTQVDRKRWPEEPQGLPCPHPRITKKELVTIKRETYLKAYLDKDRIYRLMKMANSSLEAKKTLLAINSFLQPALAKI